MDNVTCVRILQETLSRIKAVNALFDSCKEDDLRHYLCGKKQAYQNIANFLFGVISALTGDQLNSVKSEEE